jgi:hypothetical protein
MPDEQVDLFIVGVYSEMALKGVSGHIAQSADRHVAEGEPREHGRVLQK